MKNSFWGNHHQTIISYYVILLVLFFGIFIVFQTILLEKKMRSLESNLVSLSEETFVLSQNVFSLMKVTETILDSSIKVDDKKGKITILEDFEITGYSTDDYSINVPKWRDGKTASNKRVRPGFCAADWNVLPKGSVIIIDNFGICVIEDKGGAIKGNKIDIFFEDVREAKKWGRRKNQKIVVFNF